MGLPYRKILLLPGETILSHEKYEVGLAKPVIVLTIGQLNGEAPAEEKPARHKRRENAFKHWTTEEENQLMEIRDKHPHNYAAIAATRLKRSRSSFENRAFIVLDRTRKNGGI